MDMLHAARDRTARETCRVVLVGDFSAGKSTLINSLLGESLLAVGPVPTTTELTVVHPGDTFHPVFPAVPVPSGSPWLSREHIELVDTPGLGAPEVGSAEREALVSTAVRSSDLTILVTPGVGGLTLPDQRLLRRLAAPGRARLPLIVVTMLDGPDDDEVLRRAALVARRVDPAIEVLPAPGPDRDDPVSLRRRLRLKERLTRIAREHHTDGYRRRARREALITACQDMRAIADSGIAAATAGARRRGGMRERLAAERTANQALWLELRLELDDQANRLRTVITRRTRECCADVVRTCLRQLRTSAEPGSLWADELAETVADALDRHEAAMERIVADALFNAAGEADVRFSASARPDDRLDLPVSLGPMAPRPLPPGPLRSATFVEVTAELIAETGEALASLGLEAELPKSPASEFTGLIGGLISVPLRRHLLDRQRAALATEVRAGLERWRDVYSAAAGRRVGVLFTGLAGAAQRRQESWWEARDRAWAAGGTDLCDRAGGDRGGLTPRLRLAALAPIRPVPCPPVGIVGRSCTSIAP